MLAIIGALFIFSKTKNNEKEQILKKQKEFEQNKLLVFRSMVETIENTISIQLESLEGFVSGFEEEDDEDEKVMIPIFGVVTNADISRLVNSNSYEDFMLAYIKYVGKEKADVQCFLNIYSNSEFFFALNNKIDAEYVKAKDLNYLRRTKATDLIEEFSKILNSAYISNTEISNSKPYEDLRSEFTSTNTIVAFYANICPRIITLIDSMILEERFSHEVIRIHGAFKNLYSDIIYNKESLKSDFIKYIDQYKKAKSDFEADLEKIKGYYAGR